MHSAKKHRARNIKAAERPVTLAKPEELLTGLALMLHNGLNRRGRQHPCFLLGAKNKGVAMNCMGTSLLPGFRHFRAQKPLVLLRVTVVTNDAEILALIKDDKTRQEHLHAKNHALIIKGLLFTKVKHLGENIFEAEVRTDKFAKNMLGLKTTVYKTIEVIINTNDQEVLKLLQPAIDAWEVYLASLSSDAQTKSDNLSPLVGSLTLNGVICTNILRISENYFQVNMPKDQFSKKMLGPDTIVFKPSSATMRLA